MFKRIDERPSYMKSNSEILISEKDIYSILQNAYLHDCRSHYVVTKEGNYEDKGLDFGLAPERIKILEEALLRGLTVLVKDLENWNEKIQKRCLELGKNVNTHMYLTPQKGSGFDWHTDDRDVYVQMQSGQKTFQVEEHNGEIKSYLLRAGDTLFIPYGAKHKATANEGVSCHLSFGVWPEKTIEELYENFNFPLKFKL